MILDNIIGAWRWMVAVCAMGLMVWRMLADALLRKLSGEQNNPHHVIAYRDCMMCRGRLLWKQCPICAERHQNEKPWDRPLRTDKEDR